MWTTILKNTRVPIILTWRGVNATNIFLLKNDFLTTELKRGHIKQLDESSEEGCMYINPLNPELNSICYLLALLGAHHFLHVSRIRVKSLTLGLLMSYIYRAPILDVSRSHTTTQHSR